MRPTRLPLLSLVATAALFQGCSEPEPASPPAASAGPTPTIGLPAAPTADPSPAARTEGPPVGWVTREPMIRVRIVNGVERATIDGASPVWATVVPIKGGGEPWKFAVTLPVSVFATEHGLMLRDAGGRGTANAGVESVWLDAPRDRAFRINGTDYRGRMHVLASDKGERLNVINHLPLERYLAGVLEKELYASWHPSAFEAQAIAARSYALYEMWVHRTRGWDLESTTASQAFAGDNTRPKPRQAVAATRGRVLTHEGRVVPAFYSSTCGGVGQDAHAVMPVRRHAPLDGQARGTWCSRSTKYQWQVSRSASTLGQRIAAWGRANRHPVASLRGLTSIEVARRNAVGRPTVFTVTDAIGRSYQLGAERFRFACNYTGGRLPPIPQGQSLWSSHVSPHVANGRANFSGRGFGHGVGMCQWGAQGLATAGYPAASILGHYYAGAETTPLY